MSVFDPNLFLSGTTTEAYQRRPPLPSGDYIAVIEDIKAQSGQQKKDPSKEWYAFNVQLGVDPGRAREVVGQDKVILFHFVGLDVTPTGSLDWSPGRNRQLGRYREALGMNVAGQPFNPQAMLGRTVTVKVGQEEYEGEIRDTVDTVAKVA
jgi:hypothetical protein